MNKALSLLGAAAASLALDAHSEGFAGIAAGTARWSSDFCVPSGPCDRSDTAWSARAGYMFSPYVGIEARYVDLGRVTSTYTAAIPNQEQRFDANGAGVGAALAFPFADRFRLTGAVGVARTRTRYKIPDMTMPATGGESGIVIVNGLSHTETKAKPYYAVGLDYAFAPNFSVGVEAARYRAGVAGTADVDTLMGGITYRFLGISATPPSRASRPCPSNGI